MLSVEVQRDCRVAKLEVKREAVSKMIECVIKLQGYMATEGRGLAGSLRPW